MRGALTRLDREKPMIASTMLMPLAELAAGVVALAGLVAFVLRQKEQARVPAKVQVRLRSRRPR
jgi:hypothetical protein